MPAALGRHIVVDVDRQGVQSLKQSGNPAQIGMFQYQIPGSALGQHLPYTIPLLLLAVSGLGHLGPEVVRIKDQAVEQESRYDVAATLCALISPDPESRDTSTGRTSLECHCRIELLPTSNTPAHALGYYVQRTVAPRTSVPNQHHTIEEPVGFRPKSLHGFGELTSHNADVHRSALRGW